MEQLMQKYLEYRRTLGLSPDTLTSDHTALQKFNRYLQTHGLQFTKITPPEVEAYFSDIAATQKPTGAYKFLSVLKCFYRYLYSQNLILLNPCREIELPAYRPASAEEYSHPGTD